MPLSLISSLYDFRCHVIVAILFAYNAQFHFIISAIVLTAKALRRPKQPQEDVATQQYFRGLKRITIRTRLSKSIQYLESVLIRSRRYGKRSR